MTFDRIDNIWTIDLAGLPNATRGRIYLERAKWVVRDALSRASERSVAVNGVRFRRSYLIERIGCPPAVPSRNPGIKDLLRQVDEGLRSEAQHRSPRRRDLTNRLATLELVVGELKAELARQGEALVRLSAAAGAAGASVTSDARGPEERRRCGNKDIGR